MKMSAVIGTQGTFEANGIASVVTICANQKRLRVPPRATPAELAAGSQATLSDQWLALLGTLPSAAPARGIYAGRAFGLVRDLAAARAGRLYVVSAGLGLVDSATDVPVYGLTITRGVAESISDRATDGFDPASWFSRLMIGPYSIGWDEVFGPGAGRVLIALTRPYAEMIGLSLAGLPQALRARIRIFGAGLTSVLPTPIASQVLPYDDRLDTLAPGTKSDFAQRALVHFVDQVAAGYADTAADIARVIETLSTVARPARVVRRPATDADLLTLIRARLSPRASASRLLRQLRDEDQIACEQSRFAKLFRQVQLEGQTQ